MACIDEYIDWNNARIMLVDLFKATEKAINLCGSMMIKAGALKSSDDMLFTILDSIEISDEQLRQIAQHYIKIVEEIKMMASTLNKNEINSYAE